MTRSERREGKRMSGVLHWTSDSRDKEVSYKTEQSDELAVVDCAVM
jgi:hypothetical protein